MADPGTRDNFGAPFYTRRERLVIRGYWLQNLIWDRWIRWRYRDRVRFGKNVRVDAGTMLVSGLGTVELGDNVILERGSAHRTLFHLEEGSRVVLGAGTWFQHYVDDIVFSCKAGAEIRLAERCWMASGIVAATNRITFGEHAEIGLGCIFIDSDFHRLDNHAPEPDSKPVHIGAYTWLISHITVRKGVTIGDHCVIGAGSLVTTDIPDHSFAAGRPAKVIKKIGDRDKVDEFKPGF